MAPRVALAVHGGFLEVDTSPGAAEGLAEGDGPLPGLSTRVTLLAGVAELADRDRRGPGRAGQGGGCPARGRARLGTGRRERCGGEGDGARRPALAAPAEAALAPGRAPVERRRLRRMR